MKRIISLILAFTMVLSLCVCTTAFANDVSLANVALSKETWSSGYYWADTNAKSDKLVDGVGGSTGLSNANYWTPHNDSDPDGIAKGKVNVGGTDYAYAVVDLEKMYSIYDVKVYEHSGHPVGSTTYYIDFSNDIAFNTFYTVSTPQVEDTCTHTFDIEDAARENKYRFVRLRNTLNFGFNYISELEVYADVNSAEYFTGTVLKNVAFNKNAWSSGKEKNGAPSTYAFDGRADDTWAWHSYQNATNGEADGAEFGKISCPDATLNTQEYVVVDLEEMYDIHKIMIYDRGMRSGWNGAYDNRQLYIDFSNDRDFVNYDTMVEDYNDVTDATPFTIDFTSLTNGNEYRYVRIRAYAGLYLREVEVYANINDVVVEPDEPEEDDFVDVPESEVTLGNVALSKETWSSGYYWADTNAKSDKLVDGVGGSANLVNNNYWMPHNDSDPDGIAKGKVNVGGTDYFYAVVDLGKMYKIYDVNVYEHSGHPMGNQEYYIDFSNDIAFNTFYTVTTPQVEDTCTHTFDIESDARRSKYRFVRLRTTLSCNYVAELEVYADVNSAEYLTGTVLKNVAINKNAWSSGKEKGGAPSTYAFDGRATAEWTWHSYQNATNGEADGAEFGKISCPDATLNTQEYVVVDLGRLYDIHKIMIYDRGFRNGQYNCYDNRQLYIDFSNDSKFVEYDTMVQDYNDVTDATPFTIDFTSLTNGNKYRYVRIRAYAGLYLSEVEVYANISMIESNVSNFAWYADETMANAITGFDANGTAALCFDFVNLESEETDYCDIYVAKYEGNKLISVVPYLNNAVGGGVRADFVKTIDVEKGYSYKAFAWNVGTLTPIAEQSIVLK